MPPTGQLDPAPGKPRLSATPTPAIRVIAVDDHFAVRAALIDTIEAQPDMVMAGAAAGADEAIALVERERPDVVILDVNLGATSGLDLIDELRASHPTLQVVMFSIFDEQAYSKRALEAGAQGYVAKSESTQRVVDAIRVVAGGETFFRRRPATSTARRDPGAANHAGRDGSSDSST